MTSPSGRHIVILEDVCVAQ